MPWAAVRDRYLAIYDQTGDNIGWYLAIGHYVANRWVAEDVLLQGQPYDPQLTTAGWDRQLTIADLEQLERDAIGGLAAHLLAVQHGADKAAIVEALIEHEARTKQLVREVVAEHGAVTGESLALGLEAAERPDWSWFRRVLFEGPSAAFGVALFGLVVTLLAAIFSKPARGALHDLLGAPAGLLGRGAEIVEAGASEVRPTD